MAFESSYWAAQDRAAADGRAEQARLADDEPAEVVTQNHLSQELDPLDYLDEEYPAPALDTSAAPIYWLILDPAAASETEDFANESTTPRDLSSFSLKGDSSDYESIEENGSETVSENEYEESSRPKKGRRSGPVNLEARNQFVEAYKRVSETSSGGKLSKAVMEALGLRRAAYITLLDKARYDTPEIFKPAKRARR